MESRLRFDSLSRAAPVWAALVTAAALPVVLAMWETLGTSDRLGVGAGITLWTAAMVALDSRRRRRESAGPPHRLMAGALVYTIVEWIVALLAPREVLLALYGPAVALAGRFILRHTDAGDGLSAFVLTCACGGEALVIILASERLVSKFAPGRVVPPAGRS